MKKILMTLTLFVLVIGLTSCGGGGSDGCAAGGCGGDGQTLKFTITAQTTTLPANTLGWPPFSGSPFQTQVNVRVSFGNGQGVATGTIVHMQSQNTAVGYVGIPDDPTTDENEFATNWVGVNQETVGSSATYYLRSNGTGTVTYIINATHPDTGRNYETSLVLTVTQGPDPTVEQLSVSLPRTTLPINTQNQDYYEGSPFVLEGDIIVRDIFGNVTNPAAATGESPFIQVNISPTNSLYFTVIDDPTTVDDPETTEIENDERIAPKLSQGQVEMNSGHGIIYFQSKNVPGIATVTMSGVDASVGREINTEFQIEVVDDGTNPNIPTDISVNSNSSLYINGSGGVTSRAINLQVMAGNLPVADSSSNNVKLTMSLDTPNSGEKLTATNGAGSSVQGESINIATTNGIANARIHSGSNPTAITLTATADRADNNVDNGIQDGISTVFHFVVSDGVLWALELTNANLAVISEDHIISSDGVDSQNGNYTFTVSAIGTDKGGNPALPQTVEFGMINSPLSGYPENGAGVFMISGTDGDPQEGGTGFTSVAGSFITAGGGVQPNDTLVVFGEELAGNEDLESALRVATVNSETSLSTVESFNRNDETGTINNDLGIFPYVIGRAVDGNIAPFIDDEGNNTAILDENGIANAKLHFPVTRIGQLATIFVKGQGRIVNGTAKTVTDAEMMVFPAIAGLQLIVSPVIIPGNIENIGFRACLLDGQSNPIPGQQVSFVYIGPGRGTIDGQLNSGVMNQFTGNNGCAYGLASTSGVDSIALGDAGFTFNSAGVSCTLPENFALEGPICMFVDQGVALLNASPSAFFRTGTGDITLTLYDGNGNPIEGAALVGTCESDGGIISIIDGPSVTDANGESTVTVRWALDDYNNAYSGTCTFSTADGDPSTVVTFQGFDICELAISPVPSQCSGP